MAELDQVPASLFPGAMVRLQNQEGEENTQRIQGKTKTGDSAGTPHQRRRICQVEMQQGSHHQLVCGSGQRVLPPVPVHPESAGSCQAKEKRAHRKRKHLCAE